MTETALGIRLYDEKDEDAVVAIWGAAGLTRPWNDPRKDIARKLEVQRDLFLVGEAAGALVATVMAGYDGHRGWVNYLAVHPAHQRRGYARALMAEVERLLLMRGCPKVNMQVRDGNDAAMAFYDSLGYGRDQAVSLGKRLIPDA